MALYTQSKSTIIKTPLSDRLGQSTALESQRINSILEITDLFDVVLFSIDGTLTKNQTALPAGAVAVPTLRQLGKKLAIFTVNADEGKDDVTGKVNSLGLSFAKERILNTNDLQNLEVKFPLYSPSRILMVCSDVITEVALGRRIGLQTLLISPDVDSKDEQLGIYPDFISNTV